MKKAKKVLGMILVLALIITGTIAGTIAYLTDTDDAQNTFTVGNVEIELWESAIEEGVNDEGFFSYVDADGDEKTSDGNTYENLIPGSTVCKDPEITNTGSVDAYIAAIVTVSVSEGTDLEGILGCDYLDMLDTTIILSGGLAVPGEDFVEDHPLHGLNGLPVYGDEEYSVYQVPNKEAGEYKFYFFIEQPVVPEDSIVLFEQIDIPAEWTNEELALISDLAIDIEAYATQESGFDNCYEAMTTAFEGVFPTVPQQ